MIFINTIPIIFEINYAILENIFETNEPNFEKILELIIVSCSSISSLSGKAIPESTIIMSFSREDDKDDTLLSKKVDANKTTNTTNKAFLIKFFIMFHQMHYIIFLLSNFNF